MQVHAPELSTTQGQERVFLDAHSALPSGAVSKYSSLDVAIIGRT